MDKENSIDHQLRATWQAIAKMYNEEASKHGSTMAVAFILLNIDVDNGTPSTSLGPLMGMERTSLSRIIKSMEDQSLISRLKNPKDGRSVLINITDKGFEKRQLYRQSVYDFNNAIHDSVSKDDLDSFFRVIKTVNKLIIDKKIYNK